MVTQLKMFCYVWKKVTKSYLAKVSCGWPSSKTTVILMMCHRLRACLQSSARGEKKPQLQLCLDLSSNDHSKSVWRSSCRFPQNWREASPRQGQVNYVSWIYTSFLLLAKQNKNNQFERRGAGQLFRSRPFPLAVFLWRQNWTVWESPVEWPPVQGELESFEIWGKSK